MSYFGIKAKEISIDGKISVEGGSEMDGFRRESRILIEATDVTFLGKADVNSGFTFV